MSKDKTFVSIAISFPIKMLTFLDEEASAKDMNRSQVVRNAIRQYQEAEKKGKK